MQESFHYCSEIFTIDTVMNENTIRDSTILFSGRNAIDPVYYLKSPDQIDFISE